MEASYDKNPSYSWTQGVGQSVKVEMCFALKERPIETGLDGTVVHAERPAEKMRLPLRVNVMEGLGAGDRCDRGRKADLAAARVIRVT